jgi:hypothetical protein
VLETYVALEKLPLTDDLFEKKKKLKKQSHKHRQTNKNVNLPLQEQDSMQQWSRRKLIDDDVVTEQEFLGMFHDGKTLTQFQIQSENQSNCCLLTEQQFLIFFEKIVGWRA